MDQKDITYNTYLDRLCAIEQRYEKRIEELESLVNDEDRIISFCEAISDVAYEGLPHSINEHEQGFCRGTMRTCKRVLNYIGELRDMRKAREGK